MKQPSAVLFACTMNSIRSPMAEGILKYLYGDRIYVDSVGIKAEEVNTFAVAVMDEIGIDISRHQAKTFNTLADTSFDLVISLSPEAQHTAVDMTRTMACEVEYWLTFDPTAIEGSRDEQLAAYRGVRDSLMERIKERFPPPPKADT